MTPKASSVRRGRNRHDRRGLWPVRHLRAGARHLAVAARPGPEVPAAAGSQPTTHGSLSGLVGRMARASALSQVFGELVSFVQTVALARLLTPTDVGIFTAGTVLTGLFTNFVEGGLRAGLVQRQGDLADADETVFWVSLMVGAAASLGCLAAAPVIGIIFNSRAAGLVAAATAGVLLIHSLTNVPESVLQREFSVKRRLIVGPVINVTYAVVAVGLAVLGWGVWSMVAGTYAFYIAWVVSLWMITSWRPGRGHASFAMWRELARFGFPLVLGMTGFRLRTAVEALVVGRVLSTGALGFFRYGQRIAQIPQMGIIEVGATTLFPAFSRIADDRERFAAAYLRALHWAMVGGAAGTGLMIATGEPAVVVLFGERWRGAGVALVAMSGLSIGSAITVVAHDVIKARGRTRLINWFTLADLVLGVGFLLALIRPFGFAGAALYISLTSLATTVIILGLAQLVVTVPLRRVLTLLATPMPSLLVATVAAWLLEHDLLRADSRGPILAVVLLAVDTLVFCLIYLAVLTVFARPTVVTIVRIVPVLIARFRRGDPGVCSAGPDSGTGEDSHRGSGTQFAGSPRQAGKAVRPAASRTPPGVPSWGRVLATTISLWVSRRLSRLRRPLVFLVISALVLGAAAVVVFRLAGTPAGFARAASLARPRQVRPAVSSGAARSAAAAVSVRAQAAAWAAGQLGSDETIGCDPAMCAALGAHGVPAGRLLALGSASGANVIAGPASARLRDAPVLLASFGSGASRIEIRAAAPGGSAAYQQALAADLAARRSAGAQLLHGRRLQIAGPGAAQLQAGEVDSRLLIMLAMLASQHSWRVVGFGGASPGVPSAEAPLRQVILNSADGRALAAALAVVRAQRTPYQPARAAVVRLAGGQAGLLIDFTAPSPLGLLSVGQISSDTSAGNST